MAWNVARPRGAFSVAPAWTPPPPRHSTPPLHTATSSRRTTSLMGWNVHPHGAPGGGGTGRRGHRPAGSANGTAAATALCHREAFKHPPAWRIARPTWRVQRGPRPPDAAPATPRHSTSSRRHVFTPHHAFFGVKSPPEPPPPPPGRCHQCHREAATVRSRHRGRRRHHRGAARALLTPRHVPKTKTLMPPCSRHATSFHHSSAACKR